MQDDKHREKVMLLLKEAIDASLGSLGGAIERTINWHMTTKGIFATKTNWDIDTFSLELANLVGPGSELILDDAASQFEKLSGLKGPKISGASGLQRIKHIMKILGGDTVA